MSLLENRVRLTKIPTTIVTGFLGAGKTTLIRHLIENAGGRRLALLINEFGDVGVDGEILQNCGEETCSKERIIELANGCICCTVADDFLPAIEKLLALDPVPEHIVIETSGLALPKPLVKAFDWPALRAKLTVDGVIAVVDAEAVAAGRFATDPEKLAAQRAADPTIDHDNPLEEVYEDQLLCADLVVLNKCDLVAEAARADLARDIANLVPRAVKVVPVEGGRIDAAALLGLTAAAEDDLASRPSHHDTEEEHNHDDFENLVLDLAPVETIEALTAKLSALSAEHDILRIKGFVDLAGKPMRLLVQGVGTRFSHHFDRPWRAGETRRSRLVVIGRKGLDHATIARSLAASLVSEAAA
jgi:cobalamin biosynthesis protein CobW